MDKAYIYFFVVSLFGIALCAFTQWPSWSAGLIAGIFTFVPPTIEFFSGTSHGPVRPFENVLIIFTLLSGPAVIYFCFAYVGGWMGHAIRFKLNTSSDKAQTLPRSEAKRIFYLAWFVIFPAVSGLLIALSNALINAIQ